MKGDLYPVKEKLEDRSHRFEILRPQSPHILRKIKTLRGSSHPTHGAPFIMACRFHYADFNDNFMAEQILLTRRIPSYHRGAEIRVRILIGRQ